jgi:hypothetical protein
MTEAAAIEETVNARMISHLLIIYRVRRDLRRGTEGSLSGYNNNDFGLHRSAGLKCRLC